MVKRLLCLILLLTIFKTTYSQVKPDFLYNTSTPFGTLDIRTEISGSNYYYLEEGKTFSYRESAPGVKTNTYRDMTDWDSSPFDEGHMRHKSAGSDEFVMNYRLLKPLQYDENYEGGYPLILMTHGGFERANCHFENCFHADWNYDPVQNVPAAPTNPDHELLNNDLNVNLGGRQHIDARNRADGRLPDAPDLHPRAYPGFVVIPQMMNDWDSLSVENAIRIALLHIKKYNININRVYIHGLSIGGHAVYECIKRAPWLFAAALPMSAVHDGYIIKQNAIDRIVNIPMWLFQGGEDTNPSPAITNERMQAFQDAGASVRYTEYTDIGHAVWNRAYGEDDFFQFMLTKNKANLFVLHQDSTIVESAQSYPTLMLSDGFFAYQWEKDGAKITNATNKLVVKEPGVYRARFSRVASPGEAQWNRWSDPVKIKSADHVITGVEPFPVHDIIVSPNPTSGELIKIKYHGGGAAQIQIVDALGRIVHAHDGLLSGENIDVRPAQKLHDGVYIIIVRQKEGSVARRLLVRNQ